MYCCMPSQFLIDRMAPRITGLGPHGGHLREDGSLWKVDSGGSN